MIQSTKKHLAKPRRQPFIGQSPFDRLAGTLLVVVASALLAGSALAHGPVVKPAKEEVAAGATLDLSGEGIGKSAEITIRLIGVLGNYELAKVEGDEHGVFGITVTIPETVTPGTYEVEARAGKINAKAAVRILPLKSHDHGGETAAATEETGASSTTEPAEEHARAEAMPIHREWSVLESTFAGAFSLLLLGVGALCMARSRGVVS